MSLPLETGSLEFFSQGDDEPDPELAEMMATLASQIGRFFAIITEREQLRTRMERLALTDELTDLPNRRAWDQGLQRELARARRHGDHLWVALLDLDHFKAFNDDRGHQAGDALLREAAEAWGVRLRATDLLARYGGEEFALAVSAWPIESARMVIDRIREATPGGLTCSAGMAVWNESEEPDELVGRADSALYEAKRSGRDQTIVSP